MSDWRPIYKQSSLPYNPGERFLVRANNCNCNTEKINVIKCLKTRPCITDFLVVNEFRFFPIKDNGRRKTSNEFSKNGIITHNKYWKMINPESTNRKDIYICECVNVGFLGKNLELIDNKIKCCHCNAHLQLCSENCINSTRGI